MKRSDESGSSQENLSNDGSKRFKLAHGAFIPNFRRLGSPQKSASTNSVKVQSDMNNFQDSIIETISINYPSSPLYLKSVHSQEDLSQADQSLNYLREKPRVKGVGPDTDEENLYFRKDYSSSDDDFSIQALPSQPSTPCVLPRKSIFAQFKTRVQKQTVCIPSSRKKTMQIASKQSKKKIKCKLAYSANSLVDYTVSVSSQSSSSSSCTSSDLNDSSSSDDGSECHGESVRATSAENWKVQCVSRSKPKCSLSPTDSCYSATFKKPITGQKHHNDAPISSPVKVVEPKYYNAANILGYYTPTSRSRLIYDNAKKEASPKVYQSPNYLKSPELCNISPRTNYKSYYKSSIPYYDIDEISSDNNLSFIDSHCHLDFLFRKLRFNGTLSKYRLINQDTFPKSYEGCLAVFCDPETFARKNSWSYLLEDSDVWGAFGCHPKMSNGYNDSVEQHLLAALHSEKVVALGEIGLDYSTHNSSDVDVQKHVFRKQLKIAVDFQLPLVIHCRDASNDTLKILKEMVPHNHLIHRHCFTGTWKEAMEWLDPFPNMYIGLTPLVTFPSAREVHETAQNIPLNRLLLETDAPYFMPKSLQVYGEKHCSHPGMAIHVAAQVAAMRFMVSMNDVLLATRENTQKMYGI